VKGVRARSDLKNRTAALLANEADADGPPEMRHAGRGEIAAGLAYSGFSMTNSWSADKLRR